LWIRIFWSSSQSGTVNIRRIENFKRTRHYSVADFNLLVRVLGMWRSLYTTSHVLAEASNLTDLQGPEKIRARQVLKQTISLLIEPVLTSLDAANEPVYMGHGLTDAGIAATARAYRCMVLTDDLDLYLRLQREKLQTINFTHLRARMLGF
jgi:hypothetical protein